MSASRQYPLLVLVSVCALIVSLVVLMTAIKGDNTLRMVLAGVGFLIFGGLLAALVVSKSKANA
jgi:hypothetical protein